MLNVLERWPLSRGLNDDMQILTCRYNRQEKLGGGVSYPNSIVGCNRSKLIGITDKAAKEVKRVYHDMSWWGRSHNCCIVSGL